ncbi:phage head spike fiber domain-containing protein [Celeribacter indicus]|uniref:Uncharacterized protein n=1 Tax=Celeribacter indicus TaxID=1208324 RepID=A0A0B5DXD8_9RHOB|nr:hypothetical protein [Celeribacter indicus]AJE45421.1 hypothetical protein P73_0706 [Celeribacter indicus]SDX01573.1 hypothetical protein SAMN05443573_11187 [Celeribacter indicus]
MEIGLSLALAAPRACPASPPALDLDFIARSFRRGGTEVPLATVMSFARASPASYVDAAGVARIAPADTPRVDHELSGRPRGLLLEAAAANRVYPSDLGSGWNVSGGTSLPAPDGSAARLLTVNAGAGDCYLSRSVSLTLGQPHTVSLCCRRDQTRYAMLYGFGNGPAGVGFDLWAGTARVNANWTGAEIEILSPQVARIAGTLSPASNGLLALGPATSDTGEKAFSGGEALTVWNAQVETGLCATSPIPTSTAEAERTADRAGLIGISGLHDVEIAHDDGTKTVLPAQEIAEGWWSAALPRPHIARLTLHRV